MWAIFVKKKQRIVVFKKTRNYLRDNQSLLYYNAVIRTIMGDVSVVMTNADWGEFLSYKRGQQE